MDKSKDLIQTIIEVEAEEVESSSIDDFRLHWQNFLASDKYKKGEKITPPDDDIIELESEEVTEFYSGTEDLLRKFYRVPTIDITPKPKMTWEELEQIEKSYNETEDE